MGLCSRRADGGSSKRLITLDRDFMARANYDMKLQLLFHEMGHCDLNQDHSSGIMSPRLVVNQDFVSNYDALVAQLFSPETLKFSKGLPITYMSGGHYCEEDSNGKSIGHEGH